MKTPLLNLLLYIGFFGYSIYFFGLIGWLQPLPLLIFGLITLRLFFTLSLPPFKAFIPSKPLEIWLIRLLLLQLGLNFLGVFVPETSFDALWYHLPESQVYATTGLIQPIPELLYSTLPRLGEMYFTFALLLGHLQATKLASFFFSLLYLATAYLLARYFLSRPLSLLVILILNSFPLIAWQSTAAYVDLPSAVFQLASLITLLSFFSSSPHFYSPRLLFLSATFAGLALGVKIQSLLHLVAILPILLVSKQKALVTIGYLLVTIIIASPWYLDNFFSAGHPFYPLNLASKQQDQLTHASVATITQWLYRQTLSSPLILWDLGTNYVHQLSPIIALLLPFLLLATKNLSLSLRSRPFLLYLFTHLFFWHFIPPPEARYLLGALPPLIILLIKAVTLTPKNFAFQKNLTLIACGLSLVITFALRLFASFRYIPLLIGQISLQDYLKSQTTPFNRDLVEKFYSGYWSHYHYPSPPSVK